MAYVRADRVMETTTTTGTGNVTVSGAVTGFGTFAARLTTGDAFDYVIFAVDSSGVPSGAWETGVGTYLGSNVFSRSVRQSSNSDALVSFAAGTKHVAITLTASAVGVLEDAVGGLVRPSVVQSHMHIANTPAITLPAAPTPGNLLVVLAIRFNNVSAANIAAGWEVLRNANGASTDGVTILTKIANASDLATFTPFTGVTAGCSIAVFEITDIRGDTFLPIITVQEQTGLSTTTLNIGIPRDLALVVGAVMTVSADTAPTGITGATAGSTVTGTTTSASPRQVTPFTNITSVKGGLSVVATYAATPRQYGMAVCVLPV